MISGTVINEADDFKSYEDNLLHNVKNFHTCPSKHKFNAEMFAVFFPSILKCVAQFSLLFSKNFKEIVLQMISILKLSSLQTRICIKMIQRVCNCKQILQCGCTSVSGDKRVSSCNLVQVKACLTASNFL